MDKDLTEEGLQSLVGRWDDGDDLADEVEGVVADRGPMREIPELLQVFNRAAEDLTEEDFEERESLLGGFAFTDQS